MYIHGTDHFNDTSIMPIDTQSSKRFKSSSSVWTGSPDNVSMLYPELVWIKFSFLHVFLFCFDPFPSYISYHHCFSGTGPLFNAITSSDILQQIPLAPVCWERGAALEEKSDVLKCLLIPLFLIKSVLVSTLWLLLYLNSPVFMLWTKKD